MNPRPLTLSSAYREYVRGVHELHRLAVEGRDESPEADAVRDAMDLPWESLTESEKKRVAGLSEDLYSISEPAASEPRAMNPQVQSRFIEIYESRRRGEWDKALGLLRRWAAYISPSALSYLRGTVWKEVGDLPSALIFYGHASRLAPRDQNLFGLYLNTLGQVSFEDARRIADAVLDSASSHSPMVVAHAAGIEYCSARALPPGEAESRFRRLIPILQEALGRCDSHHPGDVDAVAHSWIAWLLGSCFEFLGENQAALDSYDRGLSADPTDDGLSIAKHRLLHGESPDATPDAYAETNVGSRPIDSYQSLAHDHLTNRLLTMPLHA